MRFVFLSVLLSLFLFNGCTKHYVNPETGFVKLTINEGDPKSRPYRLVYKENKISQTWMLDTSCKYYHGDEDQLDWNKLVGLSYNLTNSHDNTAMVGWRYNIDQDAFELNAYYHISGPRNFTAPLISVKSNQEFKVEICKVRSNQIQVTIIVDGNRVDHLQEFTENLPVKSRVIWPWFGGTKLPPHEMIFYYR